MAPLVTHLVVGERVFAQLERSSDEYGSLLLGCVLVDVHGFSDVDRRRTHFVGRLEEDGTDAFNKSCANFLDQLDDLLLRPWSELTNTEQAYVAGYLCHLAADEDWKRFGWSILHAMGIASLADIPVPGDVIMTAFDVLSSKMYVDLPAVVSALKDVSIPNVLTHVPHESLRAMWDISKEHVLNGDTPESYFEMLKRDAARFRDCQKRTDVMPLGSGALAGVTYDIDREFLAKELGFSEISANSLDAVSHPGDDIA